MFDLVADEVLDRGCDAAVLNTTDVSNGQLSGQYRVLREALEVPSPEGVAVQVHRWREEDSAALLESLPSHDRARPCNDRRVPGRAERACRGDADRRRDAHVADGVPTSAVRAVGHPYRRYAKSRKARGAPVVDPYGERGFLFEAECARQPCDITRRAGSSAPIRCWHDRCSFVLKETSLRGSRIGGGGRAHRCRDRRPPQGAGVIWPRNPKHLHGRALGASGVSPIWACRRARAGCRPAPHATAPRGGIRGAGVRGHDHSGNPRVPAAQFMIAVDPHEVCTPQAGPPRAEWHILVRAKEVILLSSRRLS